VGRSPQVPVAGRIHELHAGALKGDDLLSRQLLQHRRQLGGLRLAVTARDRPGSLHQFPEPILVHATSIERPRQRARLLRRSHRTPRPAGSWSGRRPEPTHLSSMLGRSKGTKRRLGAGEAGSEDPASGFSRLAPGRRAATGQQRERTGGQTVRYGTADGRGELHFTCLPARGQRAVGPATCGLDERLVTALVRCCPSFARRLRTQHGPTGSAPSGPGCSGAPR
jgi:hypothetical protein